jgi:RNA exonuclease 1
MRRVEGRQVARARRSSSSLISVAFLVMSFPTRRLFKDVTCPDYDTCTLSPCLFNHDKPAPPPPPPAASTSSVPQKRPGGTGAQAGPSKVVRTVDGAIAPARPAAVGPAQAAARLEARRAAAPPAPSAAKPLPTNVSRCNVSVLLLLTTLTLQTDPPRVASTAGLAHTPSPTRQKLLTALYDQ